MTPHLMRSAGDFEAALLSSESKPIWILKHSNSCGVSAEAFSEFERHAEAHGADTHWVLTVQNNPALSRELEVRLRLEHETPQAILLFDRRVQWTATHWDVTRESLDESLARVT